MYFWALAIIINFNPRSSCEERHLQRDSKRTLIISIHAPHARSDNRFLASANGVCISIHAPHARSDIRALRVEPSPWISIHAPHARSDKESPAMENQIYYFNPRSSCEERHLDAVAPLLPEVNFNPRSSCEERPVVNQIETKILPISIHAPHARSDR